MEIRKKEGLDLKNTSSMTTKQFANRLNDCKFQTYHAKNT